jgi:ABC-2 type transport system ATP-binding protein
MLSSHLLAEVEETCTRVAVIASGHVAFEGGLDELRARSSDEYLLETTDGARERVTLAGAAALVALTAALAGQGLGIRALTPQHRSLEDLFFELTEHRARQPETAGRA